MLDGSHVDSYGITSLKKSNTFRIGQAKVVEIRLRAMPNYNWKEWGTRFRLAIADKELNLATLAERCGKAESTVRSWVNGTRDLNLKDFFLLCEKADLDPRLVLFDTVEHALEDNDLRRISEAYYLEGGKEALMITVEGLQGRKAKKGKGSGRNSTVGNNPTKRR
jgi:transcriptional regulator with XRE-family HTH domain